MNIHNIIRIALLLTFFGLLFTGCKKGHDEKKDNGLLLTVLSPGFEEGGQITRVAGDQVKATPEESKIYSLILLVFDETEALIYKDYVFSDVISSESKVSTQASGISTISTKLITNEFNTSTNEDKYTFKIDPKQLDLTKKYTIVALANPQSMYLSMTGAGITTPQTNSNLIPHFDKSPMISKSTVEKFSEYLSEAKPLIDSISKSHFPLDLEHYGLPMMAVIQDRPIPSDLKVKLPLERMVSKLIINRIDATEFDQNIRNIAMTGSGAGSTSGVFPLTDSPETYEFTLNNIQRAITYKPESVSLTTATVGDDLSGANGFFMYKIIGSKSSFPNTAIKTSAISTPQAYSFYLPQSNKDTEPLHMVFNLPYTFVSEGGDATQNYGNDPKNNWYKIGMPNMKGNYIYECNIFIVNRGGLSKDKAVSVGTSIVVRKWDTLEIVNKKFDGFILPGSGDGYQIDF